MKSPIAVAVAATVLCAAPALAAECTPAQMTQVIAAQTDATVARACTGLVTDPTKPMSLTNLDFCKSPNCVNAIRAVVATLPDCSISSVSISTGTAMLLSKCVGLIPPPPPQGDGTPVPGPGGLPPPAPGGPGGSSPPPPTTNTPDATEAKTPTTTNGPATTTTKPVTPPSNVTATVKPAEVGDPTDVPTTTTEGSTAGTSEIDASSNGSGEGSVNLDDTSIQTPGNDATPSAAQKTTAPPASGVPRVTDVASTLAVAVATTMAAALLA